jgi:hypothetical protein
MGIFRVILRAAFQLKARQASASLFVGAKLAGEGDLKGAFAGKPGSYRSDSAQSIGDIDLIRKRLQAAQEHAIGSEND